MTGAGPAGWWGSGPSALLPWLRWLDPPLTFVGSGGISGGLEPRRSGSPGGPATPASVTGIVALEVGSAEPPEAAAGS